MEKLKWVITTTVFCISVLFTSCTSYYAPHEDTRRGLFIYSRTENTVINYISCLDLALNIDSYLQAKEEKRTEILNTHCNGPK